MRNRDWAREAAGAAARAGLALAASAASTVAGALWTSFWGTPATPSSPTAETGTANAETEANDDQDDEDDEEDDDEGDEHPPIQPRSRQNQSQNQSAASSAAARPRVCAAAGAGALADGPRRVTALLPAPALGQVAAFAVLSARPLADSLVSANLSSLASVSVSALANAGDASVIGAYSSGGTAGTSGTHGSSGTHGTAGNTGTHGTHGSMWARWGAVSAATVGVPLPGSVTARLLLPRYPSVSSDSRIGDSSRGSSSRGSGSSSHRQHNRSGAAASHNSSCSYSDSVSNPPPFAVWTDGLGRAALLRAGGPAGGATLLRLWKGLRDASAAWVALDFRCLQSTTSTPQSQPQFQSHSQSVRQISSAVLQPSSTQAVAQSIAAMTEAETASNALHVLLLAPRRGVIELWAVRDGTRSPTSTPISTGRTAATVYRVAMGAVPVGSMLLPAQSPLYPPPPAPSQQHQQQLYQQVTATLQSLQQQSQQQQQQSRDGFGAVRNSCTGIKGDHSLSLSPFDVAVTVRGAVVLTPAGQVMMPTFKLAYND